MNRYSIDIDELIAFADRLKRFNQRAEEIASAVDQQILKLHTTWEGVGAESEREYHQDCGSSRRSDSPDKTPVIWSARLCSIKAERWRRGLLPMGRNTTR
jgi:hypothetical protein